jgi:hypothetical protein
MSENGTAKYAQKVEDERKWNLHDVLLLSTISKDSPMPTRVRTLMKMSLPRRITASKRDARFAIQLVEVYPGHYDPSDCVFTLYTRLRGLVRGWVDD